MQCNTMECNPIPSHIINNHTIPSNTINTIQYYPISLNTIQYHTISINAIHYHAIPLSIIKYHAIPSSKILYHPIWLNTIQYHEYHWIPLNTIHYHTIPSSAIEYHAISLSTIEYIKYQRILLKIIKYHTITCNMIKSHPISLDATQYHQIPQPSIFEYHTTPCKTIHYHSKKSQGQQIIKESDGPTDISCQVKMVTELCLLEESIVKLPRNRNSVLMPGLRGWETPLTKETPGLMTRMMMIMDSSGIISIIMTTDYKNNNLELIRSESHVIIALLWLAVVKTTLTSIIKIKVLQNITFLKK